LLTDLAEILVEVNCFRPGQIGPLHSYLVTTVFINHFNDFFPKLVLNFTIGNKKFRIFGEKSTNRGRRGSGFVRKQATIEDKVLIWIASTYYSILNSIPNFLSGSLYSTSLNEKTNPVLNLVLYGPEGSGEFSITPQKIVV
jgi:hypothetical protein